MEAKRLKKVWRGSFTINQRKTKFHLFMGAKPIANIDWTNWTISQEIDLQQFMDEFQEIEDKLDWFQTTTIGDQSYQLVICLLAQRERSFWDAFNQYLCSAQTVAICPEKYCRLFIFPYEIFKARLGSRMISSHQGTYAIMNWNSSYLKAPEYSTVQLRKAEGSLLAGLQTPPILSQLLRSKGVECTPLDTVNGILSNVENIYKKEELPSGRVSPSSSGTPIVRSSEAGHEQVYPSCTGTTSKVSNICVNSNGIEQHTEEARLGDCCPSSKSGHVSPAKRPTFNKAQLPSVGEVAGTFFSIASSCSDATNGGILKAESQTDVPQYRSENGLHLREATKSDSLIADDDEKTRTTGRLLENFSPPQLDGFCGESATLGAHNQVTSEKIPLGNNDPIKTDKFGIQACCGHPLPKEMNVVSLPNAEAASHVESDRHPPWRGIAVTLPKSDTSFWDNIKNALKVIETSGRKGTSLCMETVPECNTNHMQRNVSDVSSRKISSNIITDKQDRQRSDCEAMDTSSSVSGSSAYTQSLINHGIDGYRPKVCSPMTHSLPEDYSMDDNSKELRARGVDHHEKSHSDSNSPSSETIVAPDSSTVSNSDLNLRNERYVMSGAQPGSNSHGAECYGYVSQDGYTTDDEIIMLNNDYIEEDFRGSNPQDNHDESISPMRENSFGKDRYTKSASPENGTNQTSPEDVTSTDLISISYCERNQTKMRWTAKYPRKGIKCEPTVDVSLDPIQQSIHRVKTSFVKREIISIAYRERNGTELKWTKAYPHAQTNGSPEYLGHVPEPVIKVAKVKHENRPTEKSSAHNSLKLQHQLEEEGGTHVRKMYMKPDELPCSFEGKGPETEEKHSYAVHLSTEQTPLDAPLNDDSGRIIPVQESPAVRLEEIHGTKPILFKLKKRITNKILNRKSNVFVDDESSENP